MHIGLFSSSFIIHSLYANVTSTKRAHARYAIFFDEMGIIWN